MVRWMLVKMMKLFVCLFEMVSCVMVWFVLGLNHKERWNCFDKNELTFEDKNKMNMIIYKYSIMIFNLYLCILLIIYISWNNYIQ
jgi:hypothetical protein